MGMAASVSCDKNILHTFWLIYHKKSSLEICLNILMQARRKQLQMGGGGGGGTHMSDLSWKVKGQPWPLEPSHCLIRLIISSENDD